MKQEFHEYRTSNAMDWDTMLSLVRKLYRDGDYRMSLLIGCGCFFGLRISDILTLTWSMLLDGEKFTIYEKKTGSVGWWRSIRVFRSISNSVMIPFISPMKMKSAFSAVRKWCIQRSVSTYCLRRLSRSITWRLTISAPTQCVRPLGARYLNLLALMHHWH